MSRIGEGRTEPGRVAVCLQLHHADLWPEFRGLLEPLAGRIRLYLALRGGSVVGLDAFDHEVSFHENYGADVAPFIQQICGVREEAFVKLHSKKSRFGARGQAEWRRMLVNGLVGSPEAFEDNARSLLSDPANAVVCGEAFVLDDREDSNSVKAGLVCRMLGLDFGRLRGSRFMAGNMFMGRTSVFREALAPRASQIDAFLRTERGRVRGSEEGTYSHSLERVFGYIVEERGMRIVPASERPVRVLNRDAPNGDHYRLVRIYDGSCYILEAPDVCGSYSDLEDGSVSVEWRHLDPPKVVRYERVADGAIRRA
jgi:lipopolysaccharide biosynthesis protein